MQLSSFLNGITWVAWDELADRLQKLGMRHAEAIRNVAHEAGRRDQPWALFPQAELNSYFYADFFTDYLHTFPVHSKFGSVRFARAAIFQFWARLTDARSEGLFITYPDDAQQDYWAVNYNNPSTGSFIFVLRREPVLSATIDDFSDFSFDDERFFYSGSIWPTGSRLMTGTLERLKNTASPTSTLALPAKHGSDALLELIDAVRGKLGGSSLALVYGHADEVARSVDAVIREFPNTKSWGQTRAQNRSPSEVYAFADLDLTGLEAPTGRGWETSRVPCALPYVKGETGRPEAFNLERQNYQYLSCAQVPGKADEFTLIRERSIFPTKPAQFVLGPDKFLEQFKGNFGSDALEWFIETKVSCPAVFKPTFKDLRIVGIGQCVTRDGYIFDNGLRDMSEDSFLFWAGANRSDIRRAADGTLVTPRSAQIDMVIDEPVVYLGDSGLPMHYHYLLDVAGKLVNLNPSTLRDRLYLIADSCTWQQLEELTTVFGLPADKLRVFSPLGGAMLLRQCEILPMGNTAEWFAPEPLKYLQQIGKKSTFPRNLDPAKAKRLFVSRLQVEGDKRRMLNERELARVLAQQGFMLIEPSRYPLMEEIALFRNAEEIVFTFGSAAANAVFCNQDVKILLLQPDSTSSKHFGMMLGCLGVTFGYVYGVSFHRRERHHNTEWIIDPKLVLEGLERLRR